MKLLGKQRLDKFVRKHTDARNWIDCWIAEVEAADWQSPQEVKNRYASASILPENVIIFNVKGNHYRLETRVTFQSKIVIVLWVGTHAEYDKRCN